MEKKMQVEQGVGEHQQPDSHHHHEPHARVEIHVNEKPVHLVGHRQTGLQIKEATIAQHVKIELDFLLYLLRHHQPNLPIGDDEEITITDESRFHAIADDDNS
jgi:hypothetical protein